MIEILRPGDVIVYRREGNSLMDRLFRAVAGNWGHASVFYGIIDNYYVQIEAVGRGVILSDVRTREGQYAAVLRYKSTGGNEAARAAFRIAIHPDSWYDVFTIMRYLIPRLLLEKVLSKLHVKLPGYRRDTMFFCSELVAEAYREAGCPIWSDNDAPTPSELYGLTSFDLISQGRLF